MLAERPAASTSAFFQGLSPGSDEPQPFERGVAVPADDDVVVHDHAERLGDRHDVQGHPHVLRRGRGIAGRMIVDEHMRRTSLLISRIYSDFPIVEGSPIGSGEA